MAEKTEAKSFESITAEAVTSLGLTDIILGGLVLYRKYLFLRHVSHQPLVTTGHDVLDIALLLCTAALLGKLLTLAIVAVMALVNVILRHTKYDNEISEALAAYASATNRTHVSSTRLAETAIALVGVDSPSRAKALDVMRTHAIIAYGAAYMSCTYAVVLDTSISRLSMYTASFAFAILGILQQANRFVQLDSYLHAPPLLITKGDPNGQ